MGSLLDCFRGSKAQQTDRPNNVPTPDLDTRRQAAAEAANRRLRQNETRGVDEDELQRMKQRQTERERIEKQQTQASSQNSGSGGLRWQVN